MLKKSISSFLCMVLILSSIMIAPFGTMNADAAAVNLDMQSSSIKLQVGAQSYEFVKDGSNTWAVDGVYVNGVKTSVADIRATTNIALGKDTMASSQAMPAGYATDSDSTSYWESTGFPGWITVDLGASYIVSIGWFNRETYCAKKR